MGEDGPYSTIFFFFFDMCLAADRRPATEQFLNRGAALGIPVVTKLIKTIIRIFKLELPSLPVSQQSRRHNGTPTI